MRMYSTLLAGAVGLALAAGAPISSQAQEGSSKSWGTKTTTYWSTEATGKYDVGKFLTPEQTQPMVQPTATQDQLRAPVPAQRMYYQTPAKRTKATKAQMRVRQQQPGMKPGTPPAGAQPTEKAQPPDTTPSAPPSGDQPTQGQPPAKGQQPQGQPK